MIAPVSHLNKSLARTKNPFYQGFLTEIATLNLREYSVVDDCRLKENGLFKLSKTTITTIIQSVCDYFILIDYYVCLYVYL